MTSPTRHDTTRHDTTHSTAKQIAKEEDSGALLAFGEPVQYRNASIVAWLELDDASKSCTSGPLKAGFTVELASNDTSSMFDWLAALPDEMETAMNITNAQGDCKEQPLASGCVPPNDLIPLPFPGTNTTFSPFQYIGLNCGY